MKKKNPVLIYRNKLLEEINATQTTLECLYSQFENVLDPDLVDSCIYQLNAVNKKYRYLLRLIKDLDATESTSCKCNTI